MLKKRLVFVLLYDNGIFMQSRNFKLQSVGSWDWLKENYDYDSIAYAIDELVVLNVSKGDKNVAQFCECLKTLTKSYFMPIAAGGGIESMEDAKALFAAGADKIILNTAYFTHENLVENLIETYGKQSIIASVDYKRNEGDEVYVDSGQKTIGLKLLDAVRHIESVGAGELLLTSMYNDGIGEGYDYDNLSRVSSVVTIPVIANGGCGQFFQFVKAFQECNVSAAATADLFNFMCDGLQEAREYVRESGVELARWDIEYFKEKKE